MMGYLIIYTWPNFESQKHSGLINIQMKKNLISTEDKVHVISEPIKIDFYFHIF